MIEQWASIEGWDRYEVSDLGRVRRKVGYGSPSGRILKLSCCEKGYARAKVCDRGKKRWLKVHRLVARAFLGPAPEGKTHIAHWDGDGMNARKDNIRWATPKENGHDKWRHGRQPVQLTAEEISALRLLASNGFGVNATARVLRISTKHVRMVIGGATRVHG